MKATTYYLLDPCTALNPSFRYAPQPVEVGENGETVEWESISTGGDGQFSFSLDGKELGTVGVDAGEVILITEKALKAIDGGTYGGIKFKSDNPALTFDDLKMSTPDPDMEM